MLGNSAGGVTRQRCCQPNLPPTLEQNTQAMVSLQAAMLFFWILLSPIPTFLSNSLLRLKFPHFVSASKKVSSDPFSHSWILQEQKIHLQDVWDLTALPISSSHRGAQPFAAVFNEAERLHLPPPLISVGCAWCSATLEKIRLFPQKLSHLLAKSYHVLFSRCRGPLFPARIADQVLRAQESASTEDQLTMWASSRKSLPRHVVLGGWLVY